MSSKLDLTVNEFLPWYGVIQSIPANWKIILKRNTPEQQSNIDKIKHFSSGIFINGSFITALDLNSKIVYQQYIGKLFKFQQLDYTFPRNLMSVMNVGPQYTLWQASLLLTPK